MHCSPTTFKMCEIKNKNKCVLGGILLREVGYDSRNGINPMIKGEILQSSDLLYNFFRQMFIGKYGTIQNTNCLQDYTPQNVYQVDLFMQVEGQAIFFSRTHISHLFTHTYTLKILITDLACQNKILLENQAAPLCLHSSDLTECFNLLLNLQCPIWYMACS